MMLSTLKRHAQQSTSFRGHVMQWAAPWHGESKSTQMGTCRRCGMEVHLNTRPMPNEIDVMGEAVALNCTKP